MWALTPTPPHHQTLPNSLASPGRTGPIVPRMESAAVTCPQAGFGDLFISRNCWVLAVMAEIRAGQALLAGQGQEG